MTEAVNTPDPYPNRIKDINKAHVMALAGNEKRIQAVNARKTHARINENNKSIWEGQDSSYLRYAKEHDFEAEKLENWAGMLYDNPVSDEYRNWHLNPLANEGDRRIDFTPQQMVLLEHHANYTKNHLTRGLDDDPDKFNAEKQTYAKRSTRWNLLKKIREMKQNFIWMHGLQSLKHVRSSFAEQKQY
jgi:uncharacterized protein YllA (UPF0747 family)